MVKSKWIIIRNNEVIGCFTEREKAISKLKEMLKQTLKDLDKQDKSCEFDYNVEIPHITVESFDERESYLGL